MKVKATQTGSGVIELVGDGKPSVECLMMPLEPLVYDVLCGTLPSVSKAAEIGSFKGGSSCILTKGMERRGKTLDLYCHDLFAPFDIKGEIHDVGAMFETNTMGWDVFPTKVKGDSKETHAFHEDGTLDYVFVDGDHSYEGAAADISNFAPKLRGDGWMIVQDSHGDVMRAVEDVLPKDFYSWVIRPPVAHFVTVANRDVEKLEAFVRDLVSVVERAMNLPAEDCSYDIADV